MVFFVICIMENNRKTCLHCSKVLRGRIDKRYCDDSCRNAYNNRQNSDRNNLVRHINNILRRNRRILEDLLSGESEMARVPRQTLHEKGFDFRYHTHVYQDTEGSAYFFWYEYGYLSLEENWLLLVRKTGINR